VTNRKGISQQPPSNYMHTAGGKAKSACSKRRDKRQRRKNQFVRGDRWILVWGKGKMEEIVGWEGGDSKGKRVASSKGKRQKALVACNT